MKFINIENQTEHIFLFEELFEEILKKLQSKLNVKKPFQVDVLLSEENTVRKLNNKYRGKNKTTDILSFPFADHDFFNFLDFIPLGQIVFDVNKVIEQSLEFNHSLKREFSYLFAHGILHLNGFDHLNEKDENQMNNLCEEIMDELSIFRT
ncbi:putative rRNA maturation factor [Mycoplasma testudineum]|uniref:Endoribonuclease YbeY n=1 Tax=Mycoplasma testudineum TaxID=244584 RepID=A0A4V3C2U7_9MOLU|nr:rRNA maturation RNase YbeY [Mycoplasma testudineum]OYD26660.1 rRNA maturation RNase YbeY [Mycoplasma testudineum]TDO19789.1 putative rRNA maturation factor [Mycoplasma testudineum]